MGEMRARARSGQRSLRVAGDVGESPPRAWADQLATPTVTFDESPSPSWQQTPPLTVDDCIEVFDRTSLLTVGVEEELMLVDPDTHELAPHVDRVLAAVEGDPRFGAELHAAQLEVITPVCNTAGDAVRELVGARTRLLQLMDGEYRLLAAGTHPTARDCGEVTEGERYEQIASEFSPAAIDNLVCGLHVHVAVPGADRALAVYNALRSYLPEIAALGANSPFVQGRDTDMSSIRPKLNEFFPRSGVPPVLRTWGDFVGFADWGREGGHFPDWSHFWWDLRPSPTFGTIEVRVADVQTRVRDAGGLVAFVQALAAWLAERYAAGDELPVHASHWISENAWRAHRYGLDGTIADLETGRPVAMRDRIEALIDEIEPQARALGGSDELADARLMLAGTGADRQRAVFERFGMQAVPRWIADETEGTLDA